MYVHQKGKNGNNTVLCPRCLRYNDAQVCCCRPAAERPFLLSPGRFSFRGAEKTWQLTGEQKYLDYAASWVHAVFDESGKVKQYKRADLDDIQAGILLYTLYDATGDEFYRRCIESVAAQVQDIPRCQCGGFWHTCGSSNQMWLDGLYMVCPFIAEYARRFDRPEWTDLVVNEIRLMREHTRDAKTGLWYHAWDESRKADWCNPETGLAPEFWGRSIGWVPVAIQDVLEQMDPDDERRAALELYVRDLLTSLLRYQSADGRWYQVVNKGDQPGNWLENSCSCLYAAALARAARTGLMSAEAIDAAKRAFDGVVNSLEWQGEDIQIGHVCIGTGVGSYQFYCDRPCVTNDLHGVGAFLLMCTELQVAENVCAQNR